MTRKGTKLLFGIILAFPCGVQGQVAQCATLHPLPNSSFNYRDRGNRCEGFYVADVGATTMEPISFQQGTLGYELKPGTRLLVTVPGQTQSVHVRAVAIPARTYYRMDAVLNPGASLTWPVDDVLLPEHLTPERIGVLAWKGSEQNKTLLPVRVENTGATSPGSHVLSAVLTVRPSFDVQRIKWRSAAVAGTDCSEFGPWHDSSAPQVLAQQPVRLSLGGLEGEHCIDIAAEAESSNEWTTTRVKLEIPR
jgi:hypothetical protein